MALNKQKGNMYDFVTHTWNPIRGKCEHECEYCYMRGRPQGKLYLNYQILRDNLGEGNFIFVGSSTDMFAENVCKLYIGQTLYHCRKYNNTYLFQTKNPKRFLFYLYKCLTYNHDDWWDQNPFPEKTVFGTTIETNRDYNISKAPNIIERATSLRGLPADFRKMINIEPIMDFDLESLFTLIAMVKPEWVSIGADSKGHNLTEPSWEKTQKLIERLEMFTIVKQKKNLDRLKK